MKTSKLLLCLLVSLSIACKDKPKYDSITLIDSQEMLDLMQTEYVQLVDVRTIKEFNEHYIKGAENIVFDDNFDEKIKKLQKDKPIILYCRTGRRSKKCAEVLAERGFKKIYDLKGGITQWRKEGFEIE